MSKAADDREPLYEETQETQADYEQPDLYQNPEEPAAAGGELSFLGLLRVSPDSLKILKN